MDADTLLYADECAAYIAELTGRRKSTPAFRRAVSVKTKYNPAPDPADHDDTGRPRWHAGDIHDWVHKRPGIGRRPTQSPRIPGYWTAEQCAADAGISVPAWYSAVYHPTKHNPAPKPVPAEEIPDADRRWRYWRIREVRAWTAARTGTGRARNRINTEQVEQLLPPGEWTARMCAVEAGVTPRTWRLWMRIDPTAPRRIRRLHSNDIYRAADARAYVHRRRTDGK